jgi:hypothetical protein
MRKYIYVAMSATILLACGENDTAEIVEEDFVTEIVVNKASETEERLEKTQMVFSTIPSPLETATLFQEVGTEYNEGITNPVENVKSYVSSIDQALNLGIYGADLSFVNIFNQTQQSMLYMDCAKILADELGVTSAFDIETIERMETNIDNKDSLMVLINDAFWVIDGHMKGNGQGNLSVLIIAGGWIECLYLGSVNLDREKPNKEIMQLIADQKYSLNSLIDLLNTYEDEGVLSLAEKLKPLQLIFNKMNVKVGETSVSESNGVATIGGGNVLTFDPEIIIEITTTIKKIRNEIIS